MLLKAIQNWLKPKPSKTRAEIVADLCSTAVQQAEVITETTLRINPLSHAYLEELSARMNIPHGKVLSLGIEVLMAITERGNDKIEIKQPDGSRMQVTLIPMREAKKKPA